MAKLIIKETAINDRKRIIDYYFAFGAAAFCEKLETAIENAYNTIEKFPMAGFPVKYTKYNQYKFVLVEKYYIFYTYENDIATIERIIHTARNYKKLLDPNI